MRDDSEGQRDDSLDDRTPQTRPGTPAAMKGRWLEKRSTPAAFFIQQGLGASGPSPQQGLQAAHRSVAAQQGQVRGASPPAQGGRLGPQSQASAQSPGLDFTPATPGPKSDAEPPFPQSGILQDLDWANANPQKRKEPPFPSAAERRMTEQERSLAEIGENVNLDSLDELHEWNKSINEGRPVEDKPKPNPPLIPRQATSREIGSKPTRKQLILGSLTGDVRIAPNPAAKSGAPMHEMATVGTNAVTRHSDDIAYAARIKGMDPTLIKAIMCMEMSHGWYDPSRFGEPFTKLPVIKSILPMNLNTQYWGDAFATNHALSTGRINVVSGAEMLRRLQKMAPGVGIAEIATLYNNHNAGKVSDYGARVAQIYKDKPWEALSKASPEKGSPK